MTVRRLVRALWIVFLIATGLLVALLAAFFVGLALEMRRMKAGDYPLADSSEVTIDGRRIRLERYSVHPLLAEYKRILTVIDVSGVEARSELELDPGGGGRLALCRDAQGGIVMSDYHGSYRLTDSGEAIPLSTATVVELLPNGSTRPVMLPEQKPECVDDIGAFDRDENGEYGFRHDR